MARVTPVEVSDNRDGTFDLRLPGGTPPRRFGDVAAVWAALDEIDAPRHPRVLRLTAHLLAAGWRAAQPVRSRGRRDAARRQRHGVDQSRQLATRA